MLCRSGTSEYRRKRLLRGLDLLRITRHRHRECPRCSRPLRDRSQRSLRLRRSPSPSRRCSARRRRRLHRRRLATGRRSGRSTTQAFGCLSACRMVTASCGPWTAGNAGIPPSIAKRSTRVSVRVELPSASLAGRASPMRPLCRAAPREGAATGKRQREGIRRDSAAGAKATHGPSGRCAGRESVSVVGPTPRRPMSANTDWAVRACFCVQLAPLIVETPSSSPSCGRDSLGCSFGVCQNSIATRRGVLFRV